jgi:hypothetical protein
MAYPITFHAQIMEDVASQGVAEGLRHHLSKTEMIDALNQSGMIQFMRILLIPQERVTPGLHGVFAIQVIIVYEGELNVLLEFFWNSSPIRFLFGSISSIARNPAGAPLDYQSFASFIKENNLNPHPKELRQAYRLTIDQVKKGFATTS